ncbi:MAG: ATP-binding protein [Spirochaetales bacterium]|nr:ATP-binding protein [Spirochaetales bacterium]
MIASKERQHGERLYKLDRYQTRLLPVAAVYGGNASGKTNLFKALNFLRRLVVRGTQPDGLIQVDPYKLDAQTVSQPSQFMIEILVDETIYEFSVSVNQKAIVEEKLVQVSGTGSQKVLYNRCNGKPNFHSTLPDKKFLNFAFAGTRDNQLFLTNSVSQKVETFRPIYDWFKDTLELVAPDSRFESFEQFLDETHPMYATMNKMLSLLDTGISHLGGEEIPFENLLIMPSLKTSIQEDVKEGETVRLISDAANERIIVTRKKGDLIAKRLVTYHSGTDGSEAKFDMQQESDGSQRIIDLLPAFLELSGGNMKRVYIINELNRSLHSLLSRRLLELYLSQCSTQSKTQLLFTTHDVLLMDQDLLRRDEMWVTERDVSGVSSLFSFSEYKDVRYDKDIRKSYLQGRLGGIPRILIGGAFKRECESNENKADG